ncbi:hypothetical protein LOK49_LG12G01115 [Camellia lanceoleosa]|uniref:Uncharacterized protein n=1 Tax=Camellia lanceoleosa TaxID=1840588 RepID=A0ACC0FVG4_9ERIC|nr:hypothetical protein LOK49_LG12G01115 [Camellia lanceoleosa]
MARGKHDRSSAKAGFGWNSFTIKVGPVSSIVISNKLNGINILKMFKRSISETALERMSVGSSLVAGTLRRQSSGKEVGSRGTKCSSKPSKLHRNASAAANMNNLASQSSSANQVPLKRTSSSFDEKLLVQTLYKEIPPDNEFEKRTRPEVIPAS